MKNIVIKECSCGAIYKLKRRMLPYSDQDEINCNYCNKEIISWRGGEEYSVDEVTPPNNSIKKLEK